MRATNRSGSPPSSAADCGVFSRGSRILVKGSGIDSELRWAQFLVGGQQQGEVVGMGGVGVEIQRASSTGIAAVDIAAQHADQADVDSPGSRQIGAQAA